jgi:hypothetical protein
MFSPRLLCVAVLFFSGLFLSLTQGSGQSGGQLSNGLPVSLSISQGDTQYWTYVVSPSDPLTGSPLLDLLFVLQLSSGQIALQVTDPSGATSSSATFSSTGALFTNRSSAAGGVGQNGSAVLYGVYTLQLYCAQSDVYTLSASMTRRQQLTAADGGVASSGASSTALNSLGGVAVNGSAAAAAALLLNTFAYADYWYNDTTQPPVQLTLTLTLDAELLLLAGLDLNTVQLPLLYWAQGVDVPAWSPASSATWSTEGLTSAGQLTTVVSTFSDCSAPPCRYSFLAVPQQSLPGLPQLSLTVVDLEAPYDAALDFTEGGLTPVQQLGNVSISTPMTDISTAGVHYYQFPVLDASETLRLTLWTPQPSTSLLLYCSMVNEFPDQAQYSWQLLPSNVQSQVGQQQQLIVNVKDPYFAQNGAQYRSMEGLYQLAVVAQSGGSYQLQLNLSDQSNETAPLIAAGQLVTTVLQQNQMQYYRFLAPSTINSQRYDLHFTFGGCALYVSDWYSTPGPSASAAQNDIADNPSFYCTQHRHQHSNASARLSFACPLTVLIASTCSALCLLPCYVRRQLHGQRLPRLSRPGH